MITETVENFPGFPEGVMGPELMDKMRTQAKKFGTKFIDKEATKVDFSSKPFKIWVGDELHETETVIIATGSTARWLGMPSEYKLMGRGVSACATCDGFFFKDKDIVVVGGGDTALEEALFLTRFAKEVKVVHRRDELRASKYMQERAFKNEKIKFVWDSVVEEILGTNTVEGVNLKNVKTGETTELKCQGVFVAIGHHPNTEIFKSQIELDENGYVVVRDSTKTNVEGVFAAGDVMDLRYKQAITAAGAGCKAALDVEKYLQSLE
jgi:thioredoxin reductase (NADPH)